MLHIKRNIYKNVFFQEKKKPAGASTRSTGLVYTQKYKKVFFQGKKSPCGSVHPQHRTCIHPKGKRTKKHKHEKKEQHNTIFKFSNCQTSNFQILKFQVVKFKTFEFPNFKFSNFRISNFQISKIQYCNNSNFKISNFEFANYTVRLQFWSTNKT